jgi:hypothetical protein
MSGDERFRTIVDLLNEARDEVEHCAFHSRGNGMSAFARAEALMRDVSLEELPRYMDVVEEVRRGHEGCHFCHMKILAYGEIMTLGRLEERNLFYKSEYDTRYGSGDRYGRNYRAEVRETLEDGYALPLGLSQ